MPHYRLYTLSEHGRFIDGTDLICPDDVTALEAAKERSAEAVRSVELWCKTQLVGWFEIKQSTPQQASRIKDDPELVTGRSSTADVDRELSAGGQCNAS